MPQVAMVVSTVGYHWEEITGAYQEFKKAGFEIEIFTIDGKKPKPDPASVKLTGPLSLLGVGVARCIAPSSEIGKEIEQRLNAVKAIDAWDTSKTDVVYLPGGHGCLFDMNKNPVLHQKIAEVYERNGVMSGVCHATSTFSFVKSKGQHITAGKKLTGFPEMLDNVLVKAGAVEKQFLPIPFSNDQALVESGAKLGGVNKALAILFPNYTRADYPFVTGMGPKSARCVAKTAIKFALKQ